MCFTNIDSTRSLLSIKMLNLIDIPMASPVDQRFLELACGFGATATSLVVASTVGRQTKHDKYGPWKSSSSRINNHSVNFRPRHIQSPLRIQSYPFDKRGAFVHFSRTGSASAICAAAFNSTCVATQTKPLTRRQQSATITLVPHREKSKSPVLDNGGPGLPPNGGGGGGGGGGGDGWEGGFFFFMFLLFLGLLRDKEKKDDYGN
ncbi:hypothetical protein DCAR_0417819 [Daucus carota subsp. sativus]|uniref:Uncharacterized protein n=1 Tax=Daucus carota subsp. sativus TaxID=79200 RepID=A0AAF1AZM8_DAUCS|nr:PREDICTED: uncharacterized protein LOC108218113 [Daucus carota subsp. sativus]WOG98476.1 hypothetical protein DCAR_0417819 [Daucus carota subsp. sativus]